MTLFNNLRTKYNVWWNKFENRRVVVLLGTLLGVGAFFYPIIQQLRNPHEYMTPEQKAYYDKSNLYPVQVRKQREEEKIHSKLEPVKSSDSSH